MRVRVKYTKTDRLRFISAIDLGRVFERALRQADLPIAYSEGFSPHPKVSFGDALPLGYASFAEYAELTFAAPVPLPPAMAALNAAFPVGARVVAAEKVPEGAPKLSKLLEASLWELRFPRSTAAAHLTAAAEYALAAQSLPVDRERKGEMQRVDARPALYGAARAGSALRLVLHHPDHIPAPATGLSIRPTDVHQALCADVPLPSAELILRLGQGRPVAGGLVEALEGEIEPVEPGDLRSAPHAGEHERAVPTGGHTRGSEHRDRTGPVHPAGHDRDDDDREREGPPPHAVA